MKRILGLMVVLFVLGSCHKDKEIEMIAESRMLDEVSLTINFSTSGMTSKALDIEQERAFKDINIYMYHQQTGVCKRQYTVGSSRITLSVPKGDYDVYVIANRGFDLGPKEKTEIENYKWDIGQETDLENNSVLPLAGTKKISVTGNLLTGFTLKRLVAKVNVSVVVAPNIADHVQLNTVQLVNVPVSCRCFAPNIPDRDFIVYPVRSADEFTNGKMGSFYLFENRAGENEGIHEEKYKCKETAPGNASYLHIKGQTNNKLLDYYIYLGENNTSDFNVIKNRNYTIEINIKGFSDEDKRVEITSFSERIEVTIIQADMSQLIYYPNLYHAGTDFMFETGVKLNRPLKYDIKLKLGGSYMVDGVRHTTAAGNFFSDPFITVPAGSTVVYTTFYKKARAGKDDLTSVLFFNDLSIIGITLDKDDKNVYNYVPEYYPINFKNTEYSQNYPPN